MNRIVLTLAILVACSTAAQAQNVAKNEELRAKVRELIVLMGSAAQARQVLDQMMPAFKKMAPDVPENVWSELESELDVEDLLEQMVPVYIDEYTENEINAMLTFYRSPEGRSVVQKMPVVLNKSMLVGQEWGQKAAMRVFTRLKEKGYAPKG